MHRNRSGEGGSRFTCSGQSGTLSSELAYTMPGLNFTAVKVMVTALTRWAINAIQIVPE